ncbi:hypothetical protein TSUD_249520 [Trifolium subterraneum]|nr:hypothetical protein TSUD_249520 [Trifolium subterraneum]
MAFSSYDEKDGHMIENSLAAIVVFSKSYASSTLCLNELEKIVESKRVFGLDVFSVFYDVTPSDVRYQKNSFGEAFGQHIISSEEDKLKMQKWRHCLHQVADLSGFESKNRRVMETLEFTPNLAPYPPLMYQNYVFVSLDLEPLKYKMLDDGNFSKCTESSK